jgi:hypothetical protein
MKFYLAIEVVANTHFNELIRILTYLKKLKAKYSGNPNPIALNYNSNGVITLQLPQGPDTDSFFIYLFVNVIDDTDGTTVYFFPTPVTVKPNDALASSLANSIASNDANSPLVLELNSGNLNLVSKNVIALATVFNMQSSSNNAGSNATSSSSSNSSSDQNVQINNQMASLREFLVDKVSSLTVSDVSSIKVISSALSAATQTANQVSSNTAVRAFHY